MSTLKKLEHGTVLSTRFPKYNLSTSYTNPLSRKGQGFEKKAMDMITPEEFTNFLKEITSLESRSYQSENATRAAVSLVQKEFKKLGYETCLHDFGQGHLQNVVAVQKGKGPGSVVVGAHYDSRPYEGLAPGAEDNGSGVAGLLAMAKAFKNSKIVPQKSVYFVGFAGEEGGMIGSQAFAKAIENGEAGLPAGCRTSDSFMELDGEKRDELAGAIVMDEIGWVSTNKGLFPKPTLNLEGYNTANDLKDHLYSSCTDHQIPLDIITNDAPFGSDHMSFQHAVLTINGDDEAYPHYHMSTDTIDNVDAEYASNIAKCNMGALVRLAGVGETSSFLQARTK
jgi:Zn-dependent M28 family amino/carboxypeptidase